MDAAGSLCRVAGMAVDAHGSLPLNLYLKQAILTLAIVILLFLVMEVWMFMLLHFYGFGVSTCLPASCTIQNIPPFGSPFAATISDLSTYSFLTNILIPFGHDSFYLAEIMALYWFNWSRLKDDLMPRISKRQK